MEELTSLETWIASYITFCSLFCTAYVVRGTFKLALELFASQKRIDGAVCRLVSLLEIKFGKLRDSESVSFNTKKYSVKIIKIQGIND
ncbi:hypothetical protein HVX40_24150 (plasmid) [Escherichia coli]|nr:hypothetical protein [Escherichia coli]ELD1608928.1 hypothetical protein [Escherichia coli]MBA8354096.1 hypothetical protein [Escherichia coli]